MHFISSIESYQEVELDKPCPHVCGYMSGSKVLKTEDGNEVHGETTHLPGVIAGGADGGGVCMCVHMCVCVYTCAHLSIDIHICMHSFSTEYVYTHITPLLQKSVYT